MKDNGLTRDSKKNSFERVESCQVRLQVGTKPAIQCQDIGIRCL